MPIILKTLLQREDIDAVVTLGTIVKGETDHDKLIANQVARKITDLSLEFNKPIGLGISGPGVSMMGSKARIDKFATSAVTSAVKMWKELNRIQK
jgi:6,7-dimethyl-8-ribityllumazine synthase